MKCFSLIPICALFVHLAFLWSGASTETVSCVLFEDYLSPGYSYEVFYTKDKGACCKFCADDEKCVAWSRDIMTGKCALKKDCEILIAVAGAETGVKHISPQKPVLEYNGVGAYVIVAKTPPPSPSPVPAPVPVKSPPAPQQFIFSSSSSSTGGGNGEFSSSFSSVTVDENGVKSVSSTTGNAVAKTAVETPSLSLATTTVAEDGETSKLVVSYYKNATYVGTVPLVDGKQIQIVANASAEPPCLTCTNYTCLARPGIVYEGGRILDDVYAEDDYACCLLCRVKKYCVSWWRNKRTDRCVLNSNLPEPVKNKNFTGGIWF